MNSFRYSYWLRSGCLSDGISCWATFAIMSFRSFSSSFWLGVAHTRRPVLPQFFFVPRVDAGWWLVVNCARCRSGFCAHRSFGFGLECSKRRYRTRERKKQHTQLPESYSTDFAPFFVDLPFAALRRAVDRRVNGTIFWATFGQHTRILAVCPLLASARTQSNTTHKRRKACDL